MRGLKYHRVTNDLTQGQVAEHLGLTQSSYSKLERGTTRLHAMQMLKLAKLYRIKVEELL